MANNAMQVQRGILFSDELVDCFAYHIFALPGAVCGVRNSACCSLRGQHKHADIVLTNYRRDGRARIGEVLVRDRIPNCAVRSAILEPFVLIHNWFIYKCFSINGCVQSFKMADQPV